ncbi:MAG: helix-turn-helix domain-containing protein [Deltaproteobacteria bacterium]|nr:helix-turn-helix domain-containing protein [Deltaproteobacteria bacterium]
MDQKLDLPRFLTIAEASRLSGVGESVIRSAISRGDLPVFQPCQSRGGIRYLAEYDLREWMRSSLRSRRISAQGPNDGR